MNYRQIAPETIPMELLLLADPSEKCIHSYLLGSICFGVFDGEDLLGACVVNSKQDGVSEIYNLAVLETHQKRGIGTNLMRFVLAELAQQGIKMVELGTGLFGHQLAFYQSLGFEVESVVKDFFVENYDEPIFERGQQHIDMARMSKSLGDLDLAS